VNLTEKDFAGSKSFTAKDRIVGTYFFYWYDIYTKEHIIDGDGTDALTTHPPTLEDFSYKSVRWHKQQLAIWRRRALTWRSWCFGVRRRNTNQHWLALELCRFEAAGGSARGIAPARQETARIGLFYDTSTLQWNHWGYHTDLTTDFGTRFFFATVRDFFSCIPPRHWAMIEGKPIVLLYASAFAKKWDQGFIDYTKAEFPKQFGGRVPWIAPQDSWGVKGDNTCAWGGALAFRNPGIGEIGPGYDHSAVPGREPLVREREGGKFYEESWLKFLRRPSNFVMIETGMNFTKARTLPSPRSTAESTSS